MTDDQVSEMKAAKEKLMESVSRFAEGKTIIFITHREKVSARCDNILRL